ncbi:MAG: ATP-binding protein [Bacillota bacterium]|nr:ATP-binding protein [Bacillota bacterium]
MAGGWIKLHRTLREHWLWAEKPFDRRSAWIDLLLTANHEAGRVALGNEVIPVGRGELITSEVKLAEKWGWSRQKVRGFLKTLEGDGMLSVKKDSRKTMLTILRYDFYQNRGETAEEQPMHSKGTQTIRIRTTRTKRRERRLPMAEQKQAIVAMLKKRMPTASLSFERGADNYNEQWGDLKGADCPICRNKGYVMAQLNGCDYFVDCTCMAQRKSRQRLEKSGLAAVADEYTFDAFQTTEPFQKTMKTLAERFAAEGKGWFYIGGQMGCGKSHLCTAICNDLMVGGKQVHYMVWTEELPKLKALKMEEAAYAREMNRWKEAEVLYIDDFFKTRRGGTPTDADIGTAFELVNARYNSGRMTIFSGEKTLPEVIEYDEALGSRIFQRCGGFVVSVGKDRGKNYRLKQMGQ